MDKDNRIKLADIACVDNRKMEGIEELAANIAAIGLLQPILIMTAPEKTEGGKTFGVVDGRRRYRALEHLKREYLEPGQYEIFQGGTNREREAAFCANFARQNLTLAEEVEALKHLGGSQASIAALLGKTEQWVALRRNLANLTGQWVKVLNDPEHYLTWTPAKLELIAREPAEVQKAVAEGFIRWGRSLADLKQDLAEYHRLLSAAPFDTAACRECPKRSGAQGVLFADYDEKKDFCLDKACFCDKALAFVKELRTQKSLIPIRIGYQSNSVAEAKYADKVKAKHDYEFAEVRKPKKGEEPNAIVVCGENVGRLMFAVPHNGDEKAAKTKIEPKEKTVAERETDLAAKRHKCASQKLLEHLRKPDSVGAWMKRGKLDETAAHGMLLQFVMCFGLKGDYDRYGWITPKFKDEGKFADTVFSFVKQRLQEIVINELTKTLGDMNKSAVKDICGLLFLNPAEFMKAAENEIPEPKSLVAARLKEKLAKAGKKAAKADKAKASGK